MHHKFYNIKQYSYLQLPIFLVLLDISTKLKNYLEHKVKQESSHNILSNFMQNEKNEKQLNALTLYDLPIK